MLYFQHCWADPQQIAHGCARIAIRALYQEVQFYPKPGLVSFYDNGAHTDMDATTFLRSLFRLRRYFVDIGMMALQQASCSDMAQRGREAEQEMYDATDQVNTHKGAIFALGILTASLAKCCGQKKNISLHNLMHRVRMDWSLYLQNDHRLELDSNGAKVRRSNHRKIYGAYELAVDAYMPIFTIFVQLYNIDKIDMFAKKAYLELLMVLDDTNVIHRVGMEGLTKTRQQVGALTTISDPIKLRQEMIMLHHSFVEKNISPGGVADMLAFLFVLRSLFTKRILL